MDTAFIYHLLGNTQASRHPRAMTRAIDPERHAVWTLPDLAEQVQQWADEEYDTIVHPALHMTPRDAYAQSMERDGERDHKRIPYDDRFKKATFPTTAKGTALVQPGKGVRMNYLDYWCDKMRDRAVERTSVAVRYDPFDVTVGFAWINKQWRKCVCTADDLTGCSERELQLLAAELRQQNRLLYGKEQVEITQKQLADFRRKNAAKEVILRQQRHDREAKAALSILEGERGTPLPLYSTVSEELTPDEGREPLKFTTRHATSDDDTLRVLRRLR